MYSAFWLRHLSVYYMLTACFYFALMGAASKILSEQINSVEIVFFRNLIGLFIVLYALKKARNFGVGGRPILLVFRGVIGALGLLCFFYNIARIDLGTAFTFQKTAPIFIAIFSSILLKERLNKLSWVAICLGFVGILFIMQPSIDGLKQDHIIGLLGGIFGAMAITSVHELRKYYSTSAIVLSFMLCGVLLMGAILLAGAFWGFSALNLSAFAYTNPSIFGWVLIAVVGLCGYYYQIYMTKAYAATKKAGIPAAISYSDIAFSVLLGVILGDNLPNNFALLGIATVVISGLLIARQR